MQPISLLTASAILLDAADDVAIAVTPLQSGQQVAVGDRFIRALALIGAGHKMAVRDLPSGVPVRRYGQLIGVTTAAIAAGEHMHSHNLDIGTLASEGAARISAGQSVYASAANGAKNPEMRTFNGYRRSDGRSGTRNMIVVAATVNCSAHVVQQIAAQARATLLPHFPYVDNVVALAHSGGCGTRTASSELDLLQRTIVGHLLHPNVGGALVLGLGCEVNQYAEMLSRHLPGQLPPPFIAIQDSGGVQRTIAAGLAALKPLLAEANLARRTEIAASELVLALQCGGSDGFSGITANPALGLAADWVVSQGGSVILSETPEIYGAEHLLTARATTPEVAEALLDRIRWWRDYTAMHGFEMDNNPSFGNKAGGLTTIFEKSLGAVAKAGSSPLVDVCEYAMPLRRRGFTYMDSPGYDPVSATGQVASGANMMAFTTGRGSCYGNAIVPTLKISTNSDTWRRMEPDMDIDAGTVLAGESLESVARTIVETLLATASGRPSKSEAQGIGEAEYVPWMQGAVL